MDSRSFHYRNIRFPICARCTGELIGILLGVILFAFWQPGWLLALLLLLPLLIDGGIQALTRYESNNIKRLITGILFGYGLVNLFLISTIATYRWGMDVGSRLFAP